MEFDRPIAIAIILFITLLFVFFLVVPQYQKLQVVQLEAAQKKAEYQAQFDYYNDVTNLYYVIESKKDELEKINSALPEKPDFGQLIYFYQKKAKDSGLQMKNFVLSQSGAGTNNTRNIIFSINVSGRYESLRNFISALEKSARIFEISNISFGSAGQQLLLTKKNQSKNQFQTSEIFTYNLEIKARSY